MDFIFIAQQSFSAALGVNTIIFALAAIGLNMHFGYTGLLNFGQNLDFWRSALIALPLL